MRENKQPALALECFHHLHGIMTMQRRRCHIWLRNPHIGGARFASRVNGQSFLYSWQTFTKYVSKAVAVWCHAWRMFLGSFGERKCSSPEAPSDMAQRRFHMSNECKIAKAAHFHLLSSSQLLLLGWISETNFIAGGNKPPQWTRTFVNY